MGYRDVWGYIHIHGRSQTPWKSENNISASWWGLKVGFLLVGWPKTLGWQERINRSPFQSIQDIKYGPPEDLFLPNWQVLMDYIPASGGAEFFSGVNSMVNNRPAAILW